MKENKNTPAYPVFDPDTDKIHLGMTLRDHFANSVLPSLISLYGFNTEKTTEWHAEKSYKLADAMLKQREII